MKKAKGKHFAFCGLDCAACEVFIATRNNNDRLREETARKWTERHRKTGRNRPAVKPEDINCLGCLSNRPVYIHCSKCEIRKCGREKRIKNCKECVDYPCDQLKELQKHFFKPQK